MMMMKSTNKYSQGNKHHSVFFPNPCVPTATVGTFARRLGMLFHSDIDGEVAETPEQEAEAVAQADPSTDVPSLSPQPSQTFSFLAEHAGLLDTPVVPSVHSTGDMSPFLLLAEPQLEVELETEADFSLEEAEEAEEAKESPLNNRLSLSLITCREGAMSSQVFADVHCDGSSFLAPGVAEEELRAEGVDHSYAQPVEPEAFVGVPQPAYECVLTGQVPAVEKEAVKDITEEASSTSVAAPSEPATNLAAEQPQPSTKIPCLKIDPKSPSQVVFKPQWLGNGFGTNKPRVKSVQQGQFGKGGSSPLAVRVAVKNMSNENKGQSGKLKQKGLLTFTDHHCFWQKGILLLVR